MSRSLTASFRAEQRRSSGAIFFSGTAGLWRRFRTLVGTMFWVLDSRSRGVSVVIMKNNVKK
jgi:hypothetical protein